MLGSLSSLIQKFALQKQFAIKVERRLSLWGHSVIIPLYILSQQKSFSSQRKVDGNLPKFYPIIGILSHSSTKRKFKDFIKLKKTFEKIKMNLHHQQCSAPTGNYYKHNLKFQIQEIPSCSSFVSKLCFSVNQILEKYIIINDLLITQHNDCLLYYNYITNIYNNFSFTLLFTLSLLIIIYY